ncbi:MAG: xanthine dehydrogenase family protein molybdopterin-binding subunit [Gammaproteobacteria bacterium]|nr:xanthine dehydrogenase family protein molybdopterin-binding subunit [Gammaproteobacteria bacterium]
MSADGTATGVGRRHFLIGAGVVVGGLAAGTLLRPYLTGGRDASVPKDFRPHAFVRIADDDTVTVTIGKSEMGQGVYTGLPMILAEELDFDPRRLKVEFGPLDPVFNHPFLPAQFTGGSMSTITTYESLRNVGATARSMLVSAAAARWGVDAATLRTDDGKVIDPRGRTLRYGELVEAAAALPLPAKESVRLKDRKDFRYIGRPQPRLDGPLKVTGEAVFGIDVQLPEMLTAVVARSPVFGATLKSFDATRAKAVPGVVEVKQVPSGVAVIATHTWAALKGREALDLQWDDAEGRKLSTESLRAEWRALAAKTGIVGKNVGDAKAALGRARRQLDVEYELPYLAHACMEPMNAVALVKDGQCDLWVGTQGQSQDAQLAAAALGIDVKNVRIHTTFLGGGFGRRASADSDFSVEAALVANGVGKPVKVVWTREDDMRRGYYRPFSISRVRAGIGADGLPVALHSVIVGKPVLANTAMGKMLVNKEGLDPSSIEGAADIPYAIPNLRVEVHNTTEAVPNLWWRSVGHSINGFVSNGVIDELAALAGQDPFEYRRRLLADKPRHRAVLEAVAELAGWGKPLPGGHHHGIALHESFGSIVAQVAEVSVEGRDVRVHRVSCAVDCGLAINPDQVVAQMQSAIIYGLSAALRDEITIRDGAAVQGNFDSYPVLRIAETPAIEVKIVPSDGPLGGIGEPGTPPIAAAVCGGIHAATGQRIRRLPISASLA